MSQLATLRPVGTATATIARMDDLIEDLLKMKEQRTTLFATSSQPSSIDSRSCPQEEYFEEDIEDLEDALLDELTERSFAAGQDSSSSGVRCSRADSLVSEEESEDDIEDSDADAEDEATVIDTVLSSRPSSSALSPTALVSQLQEEIKRLNEKVWFQQTFIEGQRTKQTLMEEKERRLRTKLALLAQRIEDQQQEIARLRGRLTNQRERREAAEQRCKEEQDASSTSKHDHVRTGRARRHTLDSAAASHIDVGSRSSSSSGSTISVSSGSGSAIHRDASPPPSSMGSAEPAADGQHAPARGGSKRTKERLKHLIGSSEVPKHEKIAIVREDFERRDETLKRVAERLSCAPGSGGMTQLPPVVPPAAVATTRPAGGSAVKTRTLRGTQIINEFLTTEETYVHNLRTIVEVYMAPLREALLSGSEILSAAEMETLFSREITMMLTLHTTLLNELKNSATFSRALASFVPYLKIYTQYVNNFPKAIELLNQKTARSRKFAEFIKERQESPNARVHEPSALGKHNETLASLLVVPIQRLPRYELLIKDILNDSPAQSKQAQELQDLLMAVQEVNTHVNESKRREENTQKLLLIQKGLVGHGDLSLFDRIGRKFITEGRMGARLAHGKGSSIRLPSKWRKSKGPLDKQPLPFSRHLFFLFDDMLLETKQLKEREFKFKRVFLLDAISIDSYDGNEEDHERIFVVTDEEDGRVLQLKADSAPEKIAWMQAITRQIDILNNEKEELRLSGY